MTAATVECPHCNGAGPVELGEQDRPWCACEGAKAARAAVSKEIMDRHYNSRYYQKECEARERAREQDERAGAPWRSGLD